MVDKNCAVARKLREAACFFYTPKDSSIRNSSNNNNNNNNTLIYIAPACRMTSEALADSSSRATECLTEK